MQTRQIDPDRAPGSSNAAQQLAPMARVIALGRFDADVAMQELTMPLVLCGCAQAEQLPDDLCERDLLVTELAWLQGLTAPARAALAQRAGMAGAWVALFEPASSFAEQALWHQNGVKHFFPIAHASAHLLALVAALNEQRAAAPPYVLAYAAEPDADRATLADSGIAFEHAATPQLVLDAMAQRRPDLLLLDLDLPGADQLAAIVRSRADLSDLALLCIGTGAPPSGAHLAALPMLLKVLPRVQMMAAVRAHAQVGQARARRASVAPTPPIRAWLEQLRTTVDQHAVISIADASGAISYVNDRFCALSGYSRAELIGQTHRLMKSDAHPPEFFRALWHTISGGAVWHGDLCNRRADGSTYWVEATIIPCADASGQPTQYVSIRSDISASKRAHAALRLSNERLGQGQIFANIGTWDWDIGSGALYWSEQVAALFGLPAGERQTRYPTFVNALHPDDREAVLDAIKASVKHDVPFEIEHRALLPDGSTRWLLERGAVLRDADGKAINMLGVVQNIDKRKRAELALADSEKRLREAQALACIGNWQGNADCTDMSWSDQMFDIFGRARASFTPSAAAVLAAVHPDDRALVQAGEQRAQHGGSHNLVYRIVRPDGTVRHVHQLGRAEHDAAGALLRRVGTLQDISERVEAKARLSESEALFVFAVEGAGDGIWDWDMRSGAMPASGRYEAMLGFAPGALAHTIEGWRSHIHPDDVARVQQNLSDYLAGRRPTFAVELRLRCKDGSYLWGLCRGTVFQRDADGAPLRMIGIHSDITDRKVAELRLAEREHLLSTILTSAHQGFWFIDTEGRTTDVNPAMCTMMGRPRAEFIGRQIFDFVDAENAAVLRAEMEKRQRGIAEPYEITLNQPDGTRVSCLGIPSLLRDQHGVPTGSVGMFSDITELKNVHRELAALNATLTVAREDAERANHAKSDFLSSMSHELRTPMNAILGFAQMLEYDEDLNDDQQDNVTEILKGGHHLLALINEVLDLARIESGNIDVSLEPVELAPLIDDCTSLILPLAQARSLTLTFDVAPHLAVRADRVRLKQVLLNLLSNAVKYNHEGGAIDVSVRHADCASLRIAVRDNGAGIAPERLGELFLPFSRLGAEASAVEGTGIGLSIARRLAEAMGGVIGVTSQLGDGSTFWVELPAAAALGEPAGTDDVAQAPAESASARQRVLCIDDNPINLKLVARMLRAQSHIALTGAHSAQQGLALAHSERPHLILLDINMPGMDGYQVLARLRADPALAAIPVVAVTANAMPRDLERASAAGFDAYLTKPLDVGQLFTTVNRWLAASTEKTR